MTMLTKRTFSTAALLLLSSSSGFAFADQVSNPVAVAPGTEVVVKTLDLMSSQTATLGQHFPVTVAKDVLAGDQVIIPAGTPGSGTVVFARKKGSVGRSGALDVRIDYLDLPSGRLKLKAGDNLRGKDRQGGALGAQLVFGVFGALAVHGDDISMPAGTEILAVVSALPATAAAQTTVVQDAAAAAPAEPTAAPAVVEAANSPAANTSVNPASTTEDHH